MYAQPLDLLDLLRPSTPLSSSRHGRGVVGRVGGGWRRRNEKKLEFNLHVTVQSRDSTRKRDLVISTHESYYIIVRATAVGRGAERDAERNAVLAGDPKCLVYYVMID